MLTLMFGIDKITSVSQQSTKALEGNPWEVLCFSKSTVQTLKTSTKYINSVN